MNHQRVLRVSLAIPMRHHLTTVPRSHGSGRTGFRVAVSSVKKLFRTQSSVKKTSPVALKRIGWTSYALSQASAYSYHRHAVCARMPSTSSPACHSCLRFAYAPPKHAGSLRRRPFSPFCRDGRDTARGPLTNIRIALELGPHYLSQV